MNWRLGSIYNNGESCPCHGLSESTQYWDLCWNLNLLHLSTTFYRPKERTRRVWCFGFWFAGGNALNCKSEPWRHMSSLSNRNSSCGPCRFFRVRRQLAIACTIRVGWILPLSTGKRYYGVHMSIHDSLDSHQVVRSPLHILLCNLQGYSFVKLCT